MIFYFTAFGGGVKMVLKSFLLFCVLYTVSGRHVQVKDEDYPPLKWPETYNVEAKKLYLSASWVEEFKYWRSTKSSRLDANDGAVTKITKKKSPLGILYEIHPETTEEKENEMVCYKKKGTLYEPIKQINFLPDPDDFDLEGEDTVKGVDCIKFTNALNEIETKMTLWAYYDNTTSAWIPVRYEEKKFDTWHGYFKDHVLWDFFNFEADVDMGVFKIESPENCRLKPNEDDETAMKSAAEGVAVLKPEEKELLNQVFTTYKKRFNKKYAHRAEHEMRKNIFHKKWRMVEERNRQKLGYQLALNEMSDRTDAEMRRYTGLRRASSRTAGNIAFPYTQQKLKEIAETLPSEYDLRLDGLVGPVLSQEDCGSCWTFGTTAAVEGALARSNGGTLIKLSNQALLDCSWGFGNKGCEGGDDVQSYRWMMKYGLPTEQEYGPYVNQEGFCDIGNMTTTYKIRGFTNVTPFSVQALKVALINHGPLSVSVDASDAFTSYAGGILYDPECSKSNVNHEVTLVGYGEKDGDTFWIIKNSWGPYWGLDGYIHISARDNNCGVATEPTYVVI